MEGNQLIRVLLIGDNQKDVRLVQKKLDSHTIEKYDLIYVTSVSEAIKYIKKDGPADVILSDITLPDSQGLKTFRKLKRVASNLPVIFFAGSPDDSLAVAAIRKGAQDYLLKGQLKSDTLVRSIHYAIERKKFQNDVDRVRNNSRKLRLKASLLRKERVQLMALNEVKDDFISLASHQLRTPATGVKQYIGMLLEGYAGGLNTRQKEMLEIANDSNERQLMIVNDLLKVAQVDSGNLTLVKSTTDVGKLVKEVIEDIKIKFKERKQTVDISTPNKECLANIDAERFRMVVENIIDNASKYSDHGKHVDVSVVKKRGKIIVKVKDSGVGIAKDDVDKVFLKFMRVSNPLSVRVGGSGLGMYWAKKIIDLHKAEITVDSVLGKGTVFTITLNDTQ